MRVVRRDINERDGTGTVSLIPTEPEDMVRPRLSRLTQWHLYNLIRAGDTIRAPAIRKVKTQAQTGSSFSSTVRTMLTVKVTKTDFDPTAGELHVAGRVCEENPVVAIGQHHTLDLELHRQFTLAKNEEVGGWDSIALQTLNEATDLRRRAETWAVVLEEGLANICVITEYQTILRMRVKMEMPGKRNARSAESHKKKMDNFFATVLATLLRHFDIKQAIANSSNQPPPLLLAGPGFTAAAFRKYIADDFWQKGDKALSAYARDSIIIAHASSGGLHALHEVLEQEAVVKALSGTRHGQQARDIDRFFTLLRLDDGRAWYGPNEVHKAVEKGAVGQGGGTLLLSNRLFRSQDINERQRWVALHDRVRNEEKGKIVVVSSASEDGKRLDGLGGVGAILTFPLEDLDEEEAADS